MKNVSFHKTYQTASLMLVILGMLFSHSLHSHGFGHDTLVRTQGGWHDIRLISTSPYSEHRWIYAYDPFLTCVAGRVRAARKGSSNCYVRIGLDEKFKKNDLGNINCTPTQLFYLPDHNAWVPAYKLKVGDRLLSKCVYARPITHIKFVKKPLEVYSIEVEKHHSYLVGRHCVLTHNMSWPAVRLLLEIPFETAAIGGASGSVFGPPGVTFGLVVGGIVGLTFMWKKPPPGEKDPNYKLDYELEGLLKQFKPAATEDGNFDDSQKPKKSGDPAPDKKPKTAPEQKPDNNKNPKPKTPNQEAEEKARELGFIPGKNPPFNNRNKPAFKKGEKWISQDRDSHKGGYWKVFDNKGNRLGTFDETLKKRIGT
jgi:hypothetical protein